MPKFTSCLSIKLYGSILVLLISCSEKPSIEHSETDVTLDSKPMAPDLSEAIARRMDGNPQAAILLLREQNQKFPDSNEVLIQLGRALFDAKNFPLAAFRFEQALSAGAPTEIYREAAEAFLQSGDEENAKRNLEKFLKNFPDEKGAWLSYARLLEKTGLETEAINAFSRAPDLCTAQDSLILADLFFRKKLWAQASRWYRESAKKEESLSTKPLIGLLRVSLKEKDEDQAETLALALEKTHPGTIDSTELKEDIANLLRRRRLADLLEADVSTNEKGVTALAHALLYGSPKTEEAVVSSGAKLPNTPTIPGVPAQYLPESTTMDSPVIEDPLIPFNLADAFAIPAEEENEMSSLEKSRMAYLNSSYSEALFHAREALKANPSDAEAWRSSSQAHFQMGEETEAEMTILEAIRHNPFDLETRMDYLRIARETLNSRRYLVELEKAKEIFPESTEILWELARRYHLVEKMPVTASILYREVMKIAPAGSALHEQSKMELLKLKSL